MMIKFPSPCSAAIRGKMPGTVSLIPVEKMYVCKGLKTLQPDRDSNLALQSLTVADNLFERNILKRSYSSNSHMNISF
jgi:hypothetical protein